MEHILELAEKNQREAWEVIRKTDVMNIWKSVGAEINLVGSMGHRTKRILRVGRKRRQTY